jgi:thymidylate kinase
VLETRSDGLLFRIAQWEQSLYERIAGCIPDLVLLLDVTPEVAHQRRSEEPVEELERRIHIARSLTFQGAFRLVLDSSEPLHLVQEKALAAVLDLDAVRQSGFPQCRIAKRSCVTTVD